MTRRLILLALVALLATACGQSLGDPGVAATVNGETILIADVEELAVGEAGQVDPQTGTATTVDDAATQALSELALLATLNDELAELGGESVDDDAVQASIDEAIDVAGGEDAFQDALDQQGISDARLRLDQSFGILVERLTETLSGDLEIPDELVQQTYQTQFAAPDVSHILVETEAEALDVIDRLDAGEAFADVAVEVSLDPGSAASGGALGPLQVGAFVPEFEQAALALAPGEISAPVQTQFGFHVITIGEVEPLTDEIREQIVGQLQQQQAQQAIGTTVQTALDGAEVQVNPRFGTWDPQFDQQGLIQVIAATDPLGALVPVGGPDLQLDESLLPPTPSDGQ